VIFIEDVEVEKKLGQQEIALQVQDQVAATMEQKMSLPLSLIIEAATQLIPKEN